MWCFKSAHIGTLRRPFGRTMALGLLLAIATGCGFQPLYGVNHARPGALDATASIAVTPIADRIGQILRNTLNQHFHTTAGATPKTMQLRVALAESRANLLILPNATTRFAKMTLVAQFTLRTIQDDTVMLRGSSTAISSFNPQASEYANQIAEDAARKRAIDAIAADIRRQLALFLRRQPQPTPDT